MKFRRGVSLMEVLVSIGVVAVGLMGVATLIPLAFQQAETGAQNERKASLSKNAYREFHVLGITTPSRWIDPWLAFPGAASDVSFYHSPGARSAFCIDPRWIADNAYQAPPQNVRQLKNQAAVPFHFTFPGPRTNQVSQADITDLRRFKAPAIMPRISLRPFHDAHWIMDRALSDQICLTLDDLEFELPDQATLPPVQTPLTGALGPTKRYAQGRFSWFATLVPDGGTSDVYNLSIAVCRERKLDLHLADASQEVVAPVVAPYANLYADPLRTDLGVSYRGGDVTVDLTDIGELATKPGEYVMLSRHVATADIHPVAGNRIFHQRFQWYRVIAVENDLAQNVAHLTLDGADWDFKPVNYGDGWAEQVTYLIYPPGVVSVFEKTIRLEQSSLWTD